jgi:hypothetical protein
MTGCWTFSLDLLDAGDGGGARSRRQARDHVMDALYISCSLRPTRKSKLINYLLSHTRRNPILCTQPPMHSPPQFESGDVGQKEVKSHSLMPELFVFLSSVIFDNNMKNPVAIYS